MLAQGFVFIATSLDGFIARSDGAIDWLAYDDSGNGEDYGYRRFFDTMDVLVMGRNTWQQVSAFESYPYEGKAVHVLSSRAPRTPAALSPLVETSCMQPLELVEHLTERGARRLYIDGGDTIRRFLAQGLIAEMTITRLPLLIGEGIPLFGGPAADIRCRLIDCKTYDNGFVQTRYRVMQSRPG